MAKSRETTPEAEALSILADRRGRDAVAADLRAAIDRAEADAAGAVQAFDAGTKGLDVALIAIAAAADVERDARRRLAILGDDAPDGPAIGERHLGAILATDRGVSAFRDALAGATADTRAAIEDIDDRIKAEGDPDGLMVLVGERRRVKSIRAGLEKDAVLLSDTQGRAVAAAIDQAGGVDVVARGVRDAELIRGEYFEGNSRFDALVSATTEADTLKNQLGRFGESLDPADYEAGSLAFMVANKLIKARHDADKLRAAIDAEERVAIRAMLDDACRGDESSRAVLASIAAETPMAFAPGFAEALEATVSPRTEADALIAALRDKAARHAEATRIGNEKALAGKARRNATAAARAAAAAHELSMIRVEAPGIVNAEAARIIAELAGR